MAHPSKFVSVNLNKSYGKPTNYSSSGNARVRTGAHSGSVGGSGGGMVVLSRPRSSSSATGQKSNTTKLSVPPPLNLPSLRKENERFDPGSAQGSSVRPGSSGIGSGSGSSSMGWTKPGILQEKESWGRSGDQRAPSTYMPPAARSIGQVGQGVAPSSPGPVVEKAVFLRGEDFPSLKATFTSSDLKQKDLLNQKQKMREEERTEKPEFHSPLPMRPQMRSSRLTASNITDGDEGGSSRHLGGSEQSWKQQQDRYFSGPLPLVRLAHTSDWADDERDTGLSLPERDRDWGRGFSRTESLRAHDLSDGRGGRDAEVGSVPSREFYKAESSGRGDLVGSNKDGRDVNSPWRTPPPQPREGSGFHDVGFDRDIVRAKPFGVSREMKKDSTFSHLPYGDNARDGLSSGSQDSRYTRRDLGFGINGQNGKNVGDAFSGRGNEQNMRGGRYGDLSNNRYRGDSFQNSTVSKVPFSSGSKGLSLNDPILNFGREKRGSNNGKPYLGDVGFDSGDPFSGDPIGEVNVKVFKRKKEMLKQADFHDPVRESFEAELERVQRIQEQERQRVMEEQARALELARREQEERERLARAEEERRRLIEEEAREAAWRAEHEKMEAARRDEELKIVREEEKRRILMEEERRKEAARQKLLELEARIARRQTEANQKDDKFPSAIGDERVPGLVKERDVPKVSADVGDWEDGERMVEHITSTASSDSSSMNRYFDTTSSRLHSSRDGNTSFMDRGKQGNYWKRDAYDNGSSSMFHLQDQESDYRNSRRDTFSSGRGFSRKENYGGFGAASIRPSSKGGTSEHSLMPDDFRHPRGNRWNIAGDADHFNRNLDVDAVDFLDNDKFGDGGWGPPRPRGSPNASYAERSFQNSEVDGGFSSFGRSRHSLRQPRVLPPPSISFMRQSSFRTSTDRSGPHAFLDSQTRYQHSGRSDGETLHSGYDGGYHERVRQPGTTELLEGSAISSEQKEEKDSPRCDSQSSLSVSNPPSSPTHLSHDDLDEAEDSPKLQSSAVEEQTILSDNEQMVPGLEIGNTNTNATSSSVSHVEDDEWAIENNEEMEQEEYDDEDDGYQEEEDAVLEGDGAGTLDLCQEFEDPPSDVPNTTGEMDQTVLGFDEGVAVSIPIDDDFEKTSRNDEKVIGVQEDSVGDHSLQAENALSEGTVNDSSKIINDTEKALQDLVLDPVPASTNYPPDSVEAASIQGMPAQQPTASALSLLMPTTSTVQPISSMHSTVDSQVEQPVRLQFGLFSGPSLIPSPVPAIQIGSIQMPLHLHPQVGTSITQMHPSQPRFFQFGQLRYPSPISQGILPLASPQTMSFVHPPASAHYSSSQNIGSSLHNQASQDSSSQNNPGDRALSVPIEEQPGLVPKTFDPSQENISSKQSDPPKNEVSSLGQTDSSSFGEDKAQHVSVSQTERHGIHDVTMKKNYRPVTNNKESQLHPGHVPSLLGEKAQSGSRAPSMISGSRGKRVTYSARNAGTRSSFQVPETSRTDSSGFQRRPRRTVRRTEFRVRENVDRRQREVPESFNNVGHDGKPNFSGRVSGTYARYGVRKDAASNKSTKTLIESENLNLGASSSRVVSSDGKMDKVSGKEVLLNKRLSSLENSRDGEGNGKKNVSSEEDVDAPLQSGVVRVFKQPGIEAPSDEDDFIEVRSKRQMLNDRREQREKEIKAKSKVIKAPRKHRAVPQSNVVASNSNKAVAPLGGDAASTVRSDPVVTDGRGFANVEASPVFTANMTSQILPPIGTPAVKVESDTRSNSLKSSQSSSIPVTSNGGAKFVPGLSFENKNTVRVNSSLPLGSWSSPDINQQVMALTQSQLDDAMKPVRFESQVAPSISLEPTKTSTSIMAQEKPFPSLASPLNSLLAGERIQFGAVTSPTILPPVSRAVSNGIGRPGSSRSDVSKDHNLTSTNNDRAMFFDEEKHPDESCPHIEDAEAEAEAAASAVAVAAISNNDEIVGNRLGVCSIPDTKSFSGADATELITSGGVTACQEVIGQSAPEESLTVALPADLSVDTPSLPLWHPLPSPQSNSGPMLSHFPGAQPSHLPIFDMNPILGGPIFAFGPHDESAGTQAQPQRSTTLSSGPLGAWPQCHSGMDSFYGPPAGFTGPFISPGGIAGVQAPPHMVVYNHFAPVGQFGQVGLSFMGTTYIPTGKQPDWKHNPVSASAVGVSEAEIRNLNVVSGQRNPPSMPSPIQHLAPGSPLMPMASPLAMFDMSPFQSQSSGDIPFQARWSHVPAPSVHSVPLTMPLQQQQQHQVEGGMPSQFSRSLPVDTSTVNSRFNEPRSSAPGDGNRSFSVPNDGAPQFPDELNLVEPPTSSTASVQTVRPSYSPSSANNSKASNSSKSSSRSAVGNASESSGNNGGQNVGHSFKPQAAPQQSASSGQQQYLHPIGYGDQRGGASQKMGSGGEWPRRMGYLGRSQASGSDKTFVPSSKMKQIYVAKPPTSGPATTG